MSRGKSSLCLYVMLCTIWYHLYNLKSVKNTHRGELLLVKLQAEATGFKWTVTFNVNLVFYGLFSIFIISVTADPVAATQKAS